jgi:hypothetical protein
MPVRALRIVLGILVWVGVFALVFSITVPKDGAAHEPTVRLLRFAVAGPQTATISFPAGTDLQQNDPVFVVDPTRYLEKVGLVRDVRTEGDRVIAVLTVFPEQPGLLTEGTTATAFVAPWSAAWVVKTLVPKERLDQIGELAREFLRAEGDRIADTLWPQIRLGLLDLLELYERQLPAALKARAGAIQALAKKHRDGIVAEELVPAIQEVVLVKAEERFRPFLEEVGREMWRKLPIWSLGARYVWEGVPGTREGQVKSKFEAYLKDEALPILRSHAPEATRIAREVLQESLDDPRLRDALKKVASEVSSDPETTALFRDLAGELVVENEQLRTVLKKRWEAGLGEAASAASSRLEPLVKKVVDSIALTGDRREINPRLARVLRARLLKKDRRWILLTPGEGPALADPVRIEGGSGRE